MLDNKPVQRSYKKLSNQTTTLYQPWIAETRRDANVVKFAPHSCDTSMSSSILTNLNVGFIACLLELKVASQPEPPSGDPLLLVEPNRLNPSKPSILE
jgi:hypothetical protein